MFPKLVAALVLVAGALGSGYVQAQSGRRLNEPEPYDAQGLFAPYEDLHLLSTSEFTSLGHPAFPNYNVRIKKSADFCDGTVKYVQCVTAGDVFR